jgi:hypothetical protein
VPHACAVNNCPALAAPGEPFCVVHQLRKARVATALQTTCDACDGTPPVEWARGRGWTPDQGEMPRCPVCRGRGTVPSKFSGVSERGELLKGASK